MVSTARPLKWDITDELREYGADSLNVILASAKTFEDEEKPEPVEAVDELPVVALAKPFRELVEEGARAIQCSPELIAIPLLTAAGSAIGASRAIRLKAGWDEFPALYAVSVANPGDAKTPAQRLACTQVHERQAKMAKEYEELKAAFGDDDLAMNSPLTMSRVVTADATVEGLVSILRDNPRGLLIDRDELSGLVQAMNAYKAGKGADRQFYLSMWSQAPFTVDRKSQTAPVFLQRPFLAITGTIQPDCVRSMLHESKWNDGFMDRFLFANPEQRQVREWTEDVVADAVIDDVGGVFERLYSLEMAAEAVQVAQFDDEAKGLWIGWYDRNQAELKQVADPLRGPWAKMPSQCARLILICHMTRWAAGEVSNEMLIDIRSVAQGTRLAEYFKSHVRRVMNVLGEDDAEQKVRKVANWIRRRGNPGVKIRDVLAGKVASLKKAPDVRATFDDLCERQMGHWADDNRFYLTT